MRKTVDLTGRRFGKLTVIENTGEQEDHYWKWLCQCDCGKKILVNTKRLKRGTISHCGCDKKSKSSLGSVPEDLTGNRYGQLTVLRLQKYRENGKSSWLCQCECGNQCTVSADSLYYLKRKSCGCLHRQLAASEIKDLRNQMFGKLKAIEPTEKKDSKGSVVWKCICDCGTELYISQDSLIQGVYKSCGCVRQDQQKNLHENLTLVNNTCIEVLEKRKHRKDNTSGFRGVSKGPDGKWMVTIGFQGKRYYEGLYSDYNDAVEARLSIEDALHTDFIETYQSWKQQAQSDEIWAQQNPFYFDVKKRGKEFHIHTVFGYSIVSLK